MAKGDVERLPSGRMSSHFTDHQPKTQLDHLSMRGTDIGRKLEGEQDLARVFGHAGDRALGMQRKKFGEIMNQVADGGCIADRHAKRSEEAEILYMTEPQAERWTIEPFCREIEEQRHRAGIDRNIGMIENVGAQSGLNCKLAERAA